MTNRKGVDMKQCSKCGETKPTTSFYKRASKKSGLSSACKVCEINRSKAWNNQNKERASERQKRRYAIKKDELNKASREYHHKNKIEINHRRKRNRILKPEQYSLSCKNWRIKNPENVRQMAAKRRALKKQNGTYKILKKELIKIYSSPCLYCGSYKNIEADHVVPVSRGGTHSIGNLVSACRSCNASKQNKTITEWQKFKRLEH